jgi:TonB family protein
MSKKINISEFGDCFSEEKLVKYVNNELSSEENSVIDKHLEHCEMCSDVVDGLLMMDSASDIFIEKKLLDEEIDKLIAGSTKKRIILNTKFRAIAAVALLLIISGTYFIANQLTEKNQNIGIETADKDNSFDNQIKPIEKPHEQELAGLEEKATSEEQQPEPFFFSSPVHEFDSDYKVLAELDVEEGGEKSITDKTENSLDEVDSDSFTTASYDKEFGAPGSGSNSGTVPSVVQSTDSRKPDLSGSAAGDELLTKEATSTGGTFNIFDVPDKKLEEGQANKVSQKDRDKISDRDLTRNERNSSQAQSPARTEDIVVVETLSIIDVDMSVLEEEADEIEVISFAIVEQKPIYPGGDSALLKFIAENTIYPEEAKQNKIQGKVYVKFVIDTEGAVTNVEVVKGVAPILDQEAVRVIKLLPRWTPAKQRGKPVAVSYLIPINFYLD